jgi:uncharacterized protein
MRCPVDNETLVMADRGGVEIDYCPKCRGVWLDRGELDKIIDRASGGVAAPTLADTSDQMRGRPSNSSPPPVYQPEPQRPRGEYRRDDDDDDRYRPGYKKKRRESFLGELFDF